MVSILLLSGLLAGCRSFRTDFYPIGVYGIRSTNELLVVRNAFFNTVRGPANQDFFDAAHALNLKVLASPGTSLNPNFNAARARSTVKSLDRHPALWAWYLVDEPDLHRIDPSRVREAHRFVRSLPAHKPTALVIFNGNNANHYANIADVMMIDRYPIPWLPAADFNDHIKLTRFALDKDRPLIAVIQAFDWAAHRGLLPEEEVFRPPTYAELRGMTYMALLNGATGIFYYAFHDSQWEIQNHPEQWEDLKRVVMELNERLPLFQAEQIWWIEDVKYLEYAERLNAKQNLSVDFVRLRVRKGNHRILAGDYVLAVNTSHKVQDVSFLVPFHLQSSLPVLEEDRWILTEDGWFQDHFEPFEVHVYGRLLTSNPASTTE